MQATAFLDFRHCEEFSPTGKRIQVEESAKTTKTGQAAKEEGPSFGQRLASLRKAAGFTQIELGCRSIIFSACAPSVGWSSRTETAVCVGSCWPSRSSVAEKRQVLQVIDAFIERGQLKRKAESRT